MAKSGGISINARHDTLTSCLMSPDRDLRIRHGLYSGLGFELRSFQMHLNKRTQNTSRDHFRKRSKEAERQRRKKTGFAARF